MSDKKTRGVIVIALLTAGLAGFSLAFLNRGANNPQNDSSVVTIQTFHYPSSFVKQIAHDPQAGKKVFYQYCRSCHGRDPEIPLHAPRIGDKARWDPIAKLPPKQILKLVDGGFGRMPARGGCFECSDRDLKLAIEYILERSH